MRVSRYFTSRRLFILLASIIVLLAIAGLTLGQGGREASLPEQVVMDVNNAVSGWIYRPISNLTSFFSGIHSLREMYVENAELSSEMQDYQSLQAQLSDSNHQVELLKTMLEFQQQVKTTLDPLPAEVSGRDPSSWNSELTIDVGSADGVKPDMAVVSEDGSLVGRVAVVASDSSKVVLITDTELGDGVSSIVQNGTDKPPFGIIVGSTQHQGQLDMTFWAPLVHVVPGNLVVTSGLSTSIYPKNIVIGKVTSVQTGAQGAAQSAVVTPSADLDYLQNVFVLRISSGASKP